MNPKIFLPFSLVLYLACLRLPSGGLPGEPDRSTYWAFNVYRDFGLELGRDIVHIAGPLGGLLYPEAGGGSLLRASLFAALVHGAFLLCVLRFARRTGRHGPAALFLAVSSWFFFFRSEDLREVHFCGITLSLFLMDLELGRSWLFAPAAVLSAVLVLAKFNLTMLMPLQFAAYLGSARLRGDHWKRILLKGLFFVLPLAVLVPLFFSSVSSLGRWLVFGFDLAQGHSEAMSRLGERVEVILALLSVGSIFGIAGLSWRAAGPARNLSWLTLAMIPLFFEFKHGFVRADDHHIGRFFEFAPVAAATYLLLPLRRLAMVPIGLVALIGVLGPSFRFEPILPASAGSLCFQGIRDLATVAGKERAQAERNRSEVARTALTSGEIAVVGDSTVEIAPWEVILLEGTRLRWRPSPAFQYFLVRSPRLDRLNADHLEGPSAAEYIFWTWRAIDGRHPLHDAPATYLSILSHYRFVSQTGDRLLLRRGPGPKFVPRHLASSRAGWEEPIAVPPSEGMVLASIRAEHTLTGRALKALYRIPPVYIRLDDGTEFRFSPATAVQGILVSRLPRDTEQFRSLLERGRIHPDCPGTSSFSLRRPSRFNGFKDEIRIEFHELRIEPGP